MTFNRSTSLARTRLLGRIGRLSLASVATAVGIAGISAGCLDRPVGEPNPETSNVFVKQTPTGQVDKIDMVFVIDNSLSMGDKQQVLAAAVPQLLRRLTNPDCIDIADPTAQGVSMDLPNTPCATGFQKEFSPVKDIHIAVITSALGDNGGNYCPEVTADKPENIAQNDRGWMIGALDPSRTAGYTFTGDFLDWSPADASNWGTSSGPQTEQFRSLVQAAGELGCGLEMTLEAWFRFLIDPAPPMTVDLKDPSSTISGTVRSSIMDPVNGVDTQLLAQRAKFLRPDSLLAVVMLTDENDCSLRDGGIAFLPATTAAMKRGTSTCDTKPNDPCCYSCYFDVDGSRPAGCSADAACATNGGTMDAKTDYSGLRCWDQKRRFGYDFLMPIQRYVNALTKPEICVDENNFELVCVSEDSDPETYAKQTPYRFTNPIYNTPADAVITGMERTNSDLVFLAGIVGVPWQDVATAASLEPGAELQYQLASDIDWKLILPEVDESGAPRIDDVPDDPHMVQSVDPRSGSNPREGVSATIASPDATRNADTIAMHEWYPTGDLQYACTFELSEQLSEGSSTAVKDCTDNCDPADSVCSRKLQSCSCTVKDEPSVSKNPLCQSPTDGTYGTTQYAAKAYPGLRELELLRQFYTVGASPNNAIVASICPKDLKWANRATRGYGYNPAVRALVDRLKEKLGGTCLPRPLDADEKGVLPCAVVEVINKARLDGCNCGSIDRDTPAAELQTAVRRALKGDNLCDLEDGTGPACADMCLCELKQLTGDTQCLTAPNIEKDAAAAGYCYVDPEINPESAEVVAACPADQKRMLRIVGQAENPAPFPGSRVFIACAGKSYNQ